MAFLLLNKWKENKPKKKMLSTVRHSKHVVKEF